MSDIAPLGHSNGAAYTRALAGASGNAAGSAEASPSAAGRGSDKVELSPTARLLSKLHDLPDVRQDLVDRVRQQIADGGYESPAKINSALDGLAQELGEQQQ